MTVQLEGLDVPYVLQGSSSKNIVRVRLVLREFRMILMNDALEGCWDRGRRSGELPISSAKEGSRKSVSNNSVNSGINIHKYYESYW